MKFVHSWVLEQSPQTKSRWLYSIHCYDFLTSWTVLTHWYSATTWNGWCLSETWPQATYLWHIGLQCHRLRMPISEIVLISAVVFCQINGLGSRNHSHTLREIKLLLWERWDLWPLPFYLITIDIGFNRQYLDTIVNVWGSWDLFQALLLVLRQIGDRHGRSISNIATRWVLDHPFVGAVLIGMSEPFLRSIPMLTITVRSKTRRVWTYWR